MKKIKLVLIILILVIAILIGLVIYLLAIRPAISGYTVRLQSEGYAFAIASVMQQAATCQQVPLIFGNPTLNMIAIECLPPECFQQPQFQG